MIKRKVLKQRKNPYRENNEQDLTKNLQRVYKLGYLMGLLHGMRKFVTGKSLEGFNNENYNYYYMKGYHKGVHDSIGQLKLIPKNKLKSYIKELEEEIDAL
jgi:hypothetical protein